LRAEEDNNDGVEEEENDNCVISKEKLEAYEKEAGVRGNPKTLIKSAVIMVILANLYLINVFGARVVTVAFAAAASLILLIYAIITGKKLNGINFTLFYAISMTYMSMIFAVCSVVVISSYANIVNDYVSDMFIVASAEVSLLAVLGYVSCAAQVNRVKNGIYKQAKKMTPAAAVIYIAIMFPVVVLLNAWIRGMTAAAFQLFIGCFAFVLSVIGCMGLSMFIRVYYLKRLEAIRRQENK